MIISWYPFITGQENLTLFVVHVVKPELFPQQNSVNKMYNDSHLTGGN